MITPDYYDKFHCIGSECKNNCCCGGWDIEVDDAAKIRFKEISGEFGERVMSSIDDENIFIRKNGHCPLLTDSGLCEMVLHGEELCVICDEYPRFTEYFGEYREQGISLSCEAAAEIILGNEKKMQLAGDTGECNEELFSLLYTARDTIFDILQNRTVNISERIRLVLDYGEKLQERINDNDFTRFSYIPTDRFEFESDAVSVFEFLATLDYLSCDWSDMLNRHTAYNDTEELKIEQIAVYFVYRYFLKALFDCDALSKLKFMALSVIVIVCMAEPCGDIYESARRYSIETEHSEENIEMIYDEFLFNDALSTQNIINMIK